MSEESITKSDSNFAPTFVDHHLLSYMDFNGQCLIKNDISIPKKVINLYICFTLDPQLIILYIYIYIYIYIHIHIYI